MDNIQLELDNAESLVLEYLFGSSSNPKVNSLVSAIISLRGDSLESLINRNIDRFEEFIKPTMDSDGNIELDRLFKQISKEKNTISPTSLVLLFKNQLQNIGSIIQ